MELLDIVEQEDGEQQVDDQCCGGCRVPDDTLPWEREKLLTDERKIHKEFRLACGGAGLRWEGEQGVGNVSGHAAQQRAEPPLPPGSANPRSLLLGSYQAFSTRGLDHKEQLTHSDVTGSHWSPHRCCCCLGSSYCRSEEEQPEQDEGSGRTCGSRSKREGEMETGGGSGLRTRQGKLACGDPAPNCCIWERRIGPLCDRAVQQEQDCRLRPRRVPIAWGVGLEEGLAQRCWPGDHILQLRTVFILEVGSRQYLL